MNIKKIQQNYLDEALMDQGDNGDIEKIHEYIKKGADIHTGQDWILRVACRRGYLHVVKFLLTSPELKEHSDIHACEDDALQLAAKNGHLDIVQYLLTSPELKEHADIHARRNLVLTLAVEKNKFEIVDFLTTSPLLKEKINIRNAYEALCAAVENDRLEIVKFLLTSPKLDEHVILYDMAIKKAAEHGRIEILDFLFEQGGDIKHARIHTNEKTHEWLNALLLSKKLDEELKDNTANTKKNKI